MRPGLLLAALALALLSGCVNPFKPASPERPTGGVTVIEDFSDPESVLVTMERAVAAQSDGATAYANSLAPSFVATHDAADIRRAEGLGIRVPSQWTLQLERTNLFQYLVGLQPDEYVMDFFKDNSLPADEGSRGDGEVLFHRKYRVFTRRPDGTVQDTLAIGIADLTMQLDGSRWAVTLWKDAILRIPEVLDRDLLSMGYRRIESQASTAP